MYVLYCYRLTSMYVHVKNIVLYVCTCKKYSTVICTCKKYSTVID